MLDANPLLQNAEPEQALQARTALLRELTGLLARLANEVHDVSQGPCEYQYFVRLVKAQQSAFNEVVRWTAFAVRETRDELAVVQTGPVDNQLTHLL